MPWMRTCSCTLQATLARLVTLTLVLFLYWLVLSSPNNSGFDSRYQRNIIGALGISYPQQNPTSSKVPDIRVLNVNCTKLFQGDTAYTKDILKSMPQTPSIKFSAKLIESGKCNDFKKSRQYPTSALTREEADFPIAYSILLYKDVERVERLLRAIFQPQNVYCLHVDKKAPPSVRDVISALVTCFSNVFIASRLVSVVWGHYSVLEADLICMEDLVKRHKTWKYFINLTGHEFPLKTNRELVHILKTYNGANDIYGHSPNKSHSYIHRVQYVHKLRKDGQSWEKTSKTKGPMPHNITYVKGRVHITASRAFVEFAVNNRTARDLAKWLQDTAIPDESYFSALQYNKHLGAPGALDIDSLNQNTSSANRYKLFQSPTNNCGGKYVHKVCIFGVQDLPYLYREGVTGLPLFANKFQPEHQPLAYDCLEELHYSRSKRSQEELDTGTYSQLSFVQRYRDTRH